MPLSGSLRTKNARRRPQKPNNRQSWMDVWLPRISHIAQTGILLVTVGALYFTVIPLYQKALLDEAIAKKEVELKSLTKTVDDLYLDLREHVVRGFTFQAMGACSAVSVRVAPQYEKETAVETNKTREELLYAINMTSCLSDLLKKNSSVSQLREVDKSLFQKTVLKIASELDKERAVLMKEHEDAPSKINESDLYSLPRDNYSVRALEDIEGWQGGKIDLDARRTIAITVAQRKIASRYQESIQAAFFALKDIEWAPSERDSR